MSRLFEPIDVRGVRCENRIVVSPMCQYAAQDGSATDWHTVNLGHLALCGPGLAFFEATHVSPEGRITPHCLGLYSDANEAALVRPLQFLRTWTRSRIGVQLAHAGRKASTLPPWEGGGPVRDARAWTPVAPSAMPYRPDWNVPLALDARGMQKVRHDFVAATKRCARLGVDVVELHFAHGYLAHQFLSPLSNVRDDAYGGSLEARMRFPLELFDAVRAVWPEDRGLGVRISATDHVVDGWTLDEAIVFAQALRARGCDFIDCSSGGLSPHQNIAVAPGYQVPYARAIRAQAGIPTIAVGAITEPLQAEQILARGDADFVALARGFLRDPRWVWDAADALDAQAFVPDQYQRARHTHVGRPA